MAENIKKPLKRGQLPESETTEKISSSRERARKILDAKRKKARQLINDGKGEKAKKLLTEAMDSDDMKVLKGKPVNKTLLQRGSKALKKAAMGLKGLGPIGGFAAALAGKDASAAMPVLGAADSTGADPDSLAGKFESGKKLSKEEKKRLYKKMFMKPGK